MFENYLIDCCAPTLASLKSGSLFCCKCPSDSSVEEAVAEWNDGFAEYGLSMCILRRTATSALIYVYRYTSLARTLTDPEVQGFLSSFGYESCLCCEGCSSAECSIRSCLDHLMSRLSGKEPDEMRFPHEIGIFLGYPLQDVKGFIDNNGKIILCDSLDDWHTHYHCMLNETALKRLGLKDWHGANIQLSRRLWYGMDVDDNYNPPYEVVGILRDFHSGRLSEPQNPMFFSYETDIFSLGTDNFVRYGTPERVVLDMEPGTEEKTIKYLRKLKQEVLGTDELLYEWVSDQKAKLYEEDRRTARIFTTFALLAIGVTCLGVLGLMMFDVRRRYREIALRKVHGALFRDIALLLSRRYLIILGLAAAVSIPVSLIGLHKLITRYYTIHATIAWWIPLVSLMLIFLLSALTLWYQIWRATRIEPSEVMKVE